jgi:hypothetical protein
LRANPTTSPFEFKNAAAEKSMPSGSSVVTLPSRQKKAWYRPSSVP